MRERSSNAVFTLTAMAFQNILVWKQYRSLCRCSFLIAFLMPVTSLLTMLPHPSCHLWTPASSDSKVVTKLHGGRPKMQVLPRMCRKMWVMIHFPTMSVTTWNCITYTWNKTSSSHSCIPGMWPLSVLSRSWPSTHWYQQGAQMNSHGKRKKMGPVHMRNAHPLCTWLKTNPGEHITQLSDARESISEKGSLAISRSSE